MLMPLGRLAPATVKQGYRCTDFRSCCGHRIVHRINERFQRLSSVVARSERKRAKVTGQRPTDRLPTRCTLFGPCSCSPTAARHLISTC